jgi:biopolymer transport protein ExbD
MAKKRVRQSVEEAEVPMSSMIDVVFLLLIYFIVTQKPIVTDTLLGVNLPGPGSSKKKDKPAQLFTIDVMKRPGPRGSDIYHVNGQAYYFKDLKMLLENTADNDPDTTVIINCGPNARHQKLIRLLDSCAEVGLRKLNIVNDPTVAFKAQPVKRK